MPAKVPDILKWFRGKRIAILLAGVGIVVFVALGGHQKILGFAVDEMVGFLLGAGDPEDRELLGGDSFVEKEPSAVSLLSGGAILSQIGAAEAEAASTEEPVEGTPETISLAQRASDSPQEVEGESGKSRASVRKTVKAYTASFLRDPFYSLVVTDRERPTKLLDVSRAKMVGSVWGESGIIALLEDDTGRSYALRVGDRVVNGRVVSVTPASVTFSITLFGLTKSVTLELAEEGEW